VGARAHARPRPSARPGPQARVDAGHRAPGPSARSRPDAHAARPGTVERALQHGLLHARRSRRPRLLLVVVLALDVARALAYLHAPNGLVRPRPRTPAEHAQACSAGRRREGPGPPLASLPRAGRPERRAPQRRRVAAHALQQGARPAPPRAGEPASGGDCVRRPRPAAHAGRMGGRRPAAPENALEAAAQVHGDIASSNVLLTRRGAFGALGAGRLRAKARAPQHAAPCGQRSPVPAGRLRRPRRGACAPRVSRMQPHACGVAVCLRARPGRPRLRPRSAPRIPARRRAGPPGAAAAAAMGPRAAGWRARPAARSRARRAPLLAGGRFWVRAEGRGQPHHRRAGAARRARIPGAGGAGARRADPGHRLLRVRRAAVGDAGGAGAPGRPGRLPRLAICLPVRGPAGAGRAAAAQAVLLGARRAKGSTSDAGLGHAAAARAGRRRLCAAAAGGVRAALAGALERRADGRRGWTHWCWPCRRARSLAGDGLGASALHGCR